MEYVGAENQVEAHLELEELKKSQTGGDLQGWSLLLLLCDDDDADIATLRFGVQNLMINSKGKQEKLVDMHHGYAWGAQSSFCQPITNATTHSRHSLDLKSKP